MLQGIARTEVRGAYSLQHNRCRPSTAPESRSEHLLQQFRSSVLPGAIPLQRFGAGNLLQWNRCKESALALLLQQDCCRDLNEDHLLQVNGCSDSAAENFQAGKATGTAHRITHAAKLLRELRSSVPPTAGSLQGLGCGRIHAADWLQGARSSVLPTAGSLQEFGMRNAWSRTAAAISLQRPSRSDPAAGIWKCCEESAPAFLLQQDRCLRCWNRAPLSAALRARHPPTPGGGIPSTGTGRGGTGATKLDVLEPLSTSSVGGGATSRGASRERRGRALGVPSTPPPPPRRRGLPACALPFPLFNRNTSASRCVAAARTTRPGGGRCLGEDGMSAPVPRPGRSSKSARLDTACKVSSLEGERDKDEGSADLSGKRCGSMSDKDMGRGVKGYGYGGKGCSAVERSRRRGLGSSSSSPKNLSDGGKTVDSGRVSSESCGRCSGGPTCSRCFEVEAAKANREAVEGVGERRYWSRLEDEPFQGGDSRGDGVWRRAGLRGC
ncbi:hypothetical protein B0H17DRAFT_1133795 [Mycena rosella]|uniref:Uncharacterized protein n=1 Tax=Mycena rosella TaxID=1033263 RepID=A0AAD7DGM0_MYCRO|nr:hypothetical protein B0H17DRAFT_1133795 [Mycena rosella]